MTTWRRRLTSGLLALLAAGAWGAPPTWGQVVPPPGGTVPVPPISPVKGGDGTVVHSWAVSPAENELGAGSRPNLSYEVAPGAKIDDKVTVYNLGNVELTFRLYATDAFNNANGDYDLLPGDKAPVDVGKWVTLPQGGITLGPKTQATMPIVVKVPVTATPGDHAGAILASNQAEGTGVNGRFVTLDRRTGPRLYVRVLGPLAPKLTVEKLGAKYQPALNPANGKAEVTYRIENRGNIRMGGRQQASFGGPLGLASKTKAMTTLPELLPGGGVTLHATFDSAAATLLATASIRLEPVPVGSGTKAAPDRWRRFTLAPPYTILAVLLSGYLLWRARKAYLEREGQLNAGP